MVVEDALPGDLDFTFKVTKSKNVLISRIGKLVTTLRGLKALSFDEKLNSASSSKQQQLMVRITGSYKRGNERQRRIVASRAVTMAGTSDRGRQ